MNGDGRRILITGVASELSGALAAQLERDERVAYLAGIDTAEPAQPLTRGEFVRADLRNPLVARVVESTGVDTIVHLGITATPSDAGGRARMKELNVIGTMQLLAAAQKAPRVKKLVVKSTTAVYGASFADPALFREDSPPGGHQHSGYSKDAVEIESSARDFGRRRPDATLTLLRFANFIGPTVHTPLTRYLDLPVLPTVLGYDPRVQLCHEQDALEVLTRATFEDHPGIFNVAGPGIVYLSQAIRRCGKPSAAVPKRAARALAQSLRRGLVDFSPEQLAFMLYGRVGDIARLRRVFGYEPRFSTREALDDFVASGRVRPLLDRDTAARWEQSLATLLARARPPTASPRSSR